MEKEIQQQVNQFLNTNNLEITEKVFSFCSKGIQRMYKSIDPIHDQTHIYRMLQDLTTLLCEHPDLRQLINFNTLLISICWHDAWKAKQNTYSLFDLMHEYLLEGTKTSRIFTRHAVRHGLDRQLMQHSRYTIKKHAYIHHKFSIIGHEAKVLIDLDTLDAFSDARIKIYMEKYKKAITVKNIKMLKAAVWYMNNLHSEKGFYEWPKIEIAKRKKNFYQQSISFLNECEQILKNHHS